MSNEILNNFTTQLLKQTENHNKGSDDHKMLEQFRNSNNLNHKSIIRKLLGNLQEFVKLSTYLTAQDLNKINDLLPSRYPHGVSNYNEVSTILK